MKRSQITATHPHARVQNTRQRRKGDTATCREVGLGPPRQRQDLDHQRPAPGLHHVQRNPGGWCLKEGGRASVCKFPTGQKYKPQTEWLSHVKTAMTPGIHRIIAKSAKCYKNLKQGRAWVLPLCCRTSFFFSPTLLSSWRGRCETQLGADEPLESRARAPAVGSPFKSALLSLRSDLRKASQNRSRSPRKWWGIAVNPSNRRRENCTFLHVLQVLVPSADPLSDAQDSRCDLLGGCEDTWHGICNPVRRDGTASAKAPMEGGMTIPGTTGAGLSGTTGVFARYICNNKSSYICDSLRRKSFKQSVARELSAMLFQFRGSCNRKDQLLENPWKALGESHGRKDGGQILCTQHGSGRAGMEARQGNAPLLVLEKARRLSRDAWEPRGKKNIEEIVSFVPRFSSAFMPGHAQYVPGLNEGGEALYLGRSRDSERVFIL
ncbi:uncharacterized protein LOC115339061 [Aquila chrysaetos chrysaetos]|uniref:uncharacterized protein LOC115339061 n=1 Tax=Aquila chrysaetos chrysaetos TaxID=223781 RepID=UPI0011765BFB|nr:uncharacterized protein LOC115339061 [Aquila chrysaetos chrysaetos]